MITKLQDEESTAIPPEEGTPLSDDAEDSEEKEEEKKEEKEEGAE